MGAAFWWSRTSGRRFPPRKKRPGGHVSPFPPLPPVKTDWENPSFGSFCNNKSPARKHGPESRRRQDRCDFFALVALDFDRAVLDGSAAAASGAHLFRELFLLR